MEWVKFLVFSFGFGGAMLVVFVLLVRWLFRERIPQLEASRDKFIDQAVDSLKTALAEERADCRAERAEDRKQWLDALQQERDERHRSEERFLTVLDKLQQGFVALREELSGPPAGS